MFNANKLNPGSRDTILDLLGDFKEATDLAVSWCSWKEEFPSGRGYPDPAGKFAIGIVPLIELVFTDWNIKHPHTI